MDGINPAGNVREIARGVYNGTYTSATAFMQAQGMTVTGSKKDKRRIDFDEPCYEGELKGGMFELGGASYKASSQRSREMFNRGYCDPQAFSAHEIAP